MIHAMTAPATPAIPAAPVTPLRQPRLEVALQAAFEHARRLTALYGTDAVEVAMAWETVEELRHAELGRNGEAEQTPFSAYCAANPDAPECRIYDL